MRKLLHSSAVWQFAGGFVLGALGLVAFQPAAATQTLAHHLLPHGHRQAAR